MEALIYIAVTLGLLVMGLAVIAFPYILVQLLREAYRAIKQLVMVRRALRVRRRSNDVQEHVERDRQRIPTVKNWDGDP